jgi:hypothetical protein
VPPRRRQQAVAPGALALSPPRRALPSCAGTSLMHMEPKTVSTGFIKNRENQKNHVAFVQKLIFKIWKKETKNQVVSLKTELFSIYRSVFDQFVDSKFKYIE